MRYTRHTATLLALPALVLASFNCEHVQDGVKFDLRALKGTHSVTLPLEEEFPVTINRTWLINPCGPIVKEKDQPSCPAGTQVCGIELVSVGDKEPTVIAIPVAGDINGGKTNEEVTLIKATDTDLKAGLRVTLNGGEYNGTKQQAIVEFICDPDRTGLEGDEGSGKDDKEKREEDKKEDKKEDKEKKSLKFISYEKDSDKKQVLKLEWKTKHACVSATTDPAPDQGSSWGFFTWIVIILFLGVAAYLIFASWVNYTQFGHTGWDLLPHRDTLMDLPYLLKDWARRVVGTLQGRSGGRGAYSAV